MKRVFACFFCFFLSIAAFAQAKTSDEEFCAMAPIEMLAALDGNWKLKPGAGVAVTGIGALPLPPQKVQKLSFTYNPDSATVTIVDAKTGQDFILVPTTPEAAEIVLGLMKDWYKEDYLKQGEGCDWYSIPLMIATSVYALDPKPNAGVKNGVWAKVGNAYFVYCQWGDGDSVNKTYEPSILFVKGKGLELDPNYIGSDYNTSDCAPPPGGIPIQTAGQLAMHLIMKFQGPSSATGVLYFEGEMDGSKAIAIRPVTLSR